MKLWLNLWVNQFGWVSRLGEYRIITINQLNEKVRYHFRSRTFTVALISSGGGYDKNRNVSLDLQFRGIGSFSRIKFPIAKFKSLLVG